jgi:hypothetical protein
MVEWVLIINMMINDLVFRQPGPQTPYIEGRYRTEEECLAALKNLGSVLKWYARCEKIGVQSRFEL